MGSRITLLVIRNLCEGAITYCMPYSKTKLGPGKSDSASKPECS